MKNKIIKFIPGLVIMLFFYALAIILWKVRNAPFFLANFIIIGTFLGIGFGLWPVLKQAHKDIARRITMIFLGSYIFFGVGMGLMYPNFGFLRTENLQIEGFWFYLLTGGLFFGAAIHYSIAKIFGPFLFGRAFCGWVCWTALVLDLLPWRKNHGRINKGWEYFRIIHFVLGLALVLSFLFISQYIGIELVRTKITESPDIKTIACKYINLKEFWWFLLGNCMYYFIAIILAYILKDNRAFCKYVCPITVFLKIGSRFSMLKIKTDKSKCNQCGLCEKKCLMDIKITDYVNAGKRVTASECILCRNCARVCPKNALSLTFGFDVGFCDKLIRKN